MVTFIEEILNGKLHFLCSDAPEYDTSAGEEIQYLRNVLRKQNNPPFPSYFRICNYEETPVRAIPSSFLVC